MGVIPGLHDFNERKGRKNGKRRFHQARRGGWFFCLPEAERKFLLLSLVFSAIHLVLTDFDAQRNVQNLIRLFPKRSRPADGSALCALFFIRHLKDPF